MAKESEAPAAQTKGAVMTREERIERSVANIPKRFNIKSLGDARKLVNRYTGVEGEGDEARLVILDGFQVTDTSDKEQVERLMDAWRDVRDNRLGVTKVKKILKEETLTVGRAIDQRERELLEILTPGEALLKAEVDRIKEEAERRKAQLLEDRMLQLAEYGSTLPASVVSGVTEKGFTELLAEAKQEWEAEQERQRLAKEEADRAETARREEDARLKAEADKLAKAQAELEKGQAELKKAQDELAAAQKQADEDAKAKAKAEADALAAKEAKEKADAEAARVKSETPEPAAPIPEPVAMETQGAAPAQAGGASCPFDVDELPPAPSSRPAPDEVRVGGLPPDGTFVWSEDGEAFHSGGFLQEADAIDHAMGSDAEAIYVGTVKRLTALECLGGDDRTSAMVDMLEDQLAHASYELVAEAAEGWPDVSETAREALRLDLGATIRAHLMRPAWQPGFYQVTNVHQVEIPGDSEQREG